MCSEDDLQMDAIRIEGIETLDSNALFHHVLSMPWSSQRNEVYVIAVNKPLVLEIELGLLGRSHLEGLFFFLKTSCREGRGHRHVRTDGTEVWVMSEEPPN